MVVRSKLLAKYSDVVCGISSSLGNMSQSTFGFNLSYSVGDDEENVRANRRIFYDALQISEGLCAFTKQEHTDIIRMCHSPGLYGTCDGLITGISNVFLTISIADCTPVLLYDPEKHACSALHAGWRGTRSQIVRKGIQTFNEQFQSNPEQIIAFIGPSAGMCCYEVGEEVASVFPLECVHSKNNGKFLLDVKRANVLQLLDCGLKKEHIEIHPDCTIHQDQYQSFRRDGKRSGRMMAVIGIKN